MMISVTGRRSARSNPAGFSLIEVLIAVAVLSAGLTFVFLSFNTSIFALSASSGSMRAQLILREQLDSIIQNGLPVMREGMYEDRYSGFSWEITTSEPLRFKQDSLREVTMTVTRNNTGVRYSLTTYMNEDEIKDGASSGYMRGGEQ